jgi:hypothetical protein
MFNPLRTEVFFCHQNQNAKNIGYFTTPLKPLHWNPIALVLIWRILTQAFRWYHYFWNPPTFGSVISLFVKFSQNTFTDLVFKKCLTLSMCSPHGFTFFRIPRMPSIAGLLWLSHLHSPLVTPLIGVAPNRSRAGCAWGLTFCKKYSAMKSLTNLQTPQKTPESTLIHFSSINHQIHSTTW